MEIVEQIKEELKKFQEKKKELTEQLRSEFPNLIKPLLDKSELIETLSFTGYIPYFNDGDECTYSVNLDLEVNEESGNNFKDWRAKYYLQDLAEGKSEIRYQKEIESEDINLEENKIIIEIEKLLETIPEEFYKELFGEHAKIIIYKNGEIKVEEYEHE